MNIRLNWLKIENFKGIKSFEVELDGENAVIKAENGIGKTTVYDAFLWLLFGKNSEGKKDFEVRPLDKNNQPIKGLVIAVETEIECDGVAHIFKKEEKQKVIKEQIRGNETFCTIDEVPKKVGEYQDYITELISEETFKLLTDLKQFNGKLHWEDRRKVLLDIAGEIGTPEGFDELLDKLNGRSIKDYKKVLADRKNRYVGERDEINPRIDEIQRGLDEYVVAKGIKTLPARRERVKAEIEALDTLRKELFTTEKERQEKIQKLNDLKAKKIEREAELANDTSGTKELLAEKTKMEVEVSAKDREVSMQNSDFAIQQSQVDSAKGTLGIKLRSLEAIRKEYNKVNEASTDDTCYTCGQKLPADMKKTLADSKKEALAKITKEGNELKTEVDASKKEIVELEAGLIVVQKLFDKAETELRQAQQDKDKRLVEINAKIKANVGVSPADDSVWKKIYSDIIDATKEIGESVSEQLQDIDNQRTEKVDAGSQLDKALANADTMKKNTARIKELEAKEKKLAQSIADVEKELADIDGYIAAESNMIESAVNDKFKYVTFKLFNRLLNGSVEPTCEAILNGVPYPDMSAGEEIFVGIDIINVLSAHYNVSVPMFIDHAESLTLPIEADTQTIKLFAEVGVNQLQVEREGATANV